MRDKIPDTPSGRLDQKTVAVYAYDGVGLGFSVHGLTARDILRVVGSFTLVDRSTSVDREQYDRRRHFYPLQWDSK